MKDLSITKQRGTMKFGTKLFDPTDSYDTFTGVYTVPESGLNS